MAKVKVKIKRVACHNCGHGVALNIKANIGLISCPICLNRLVVNPKLAADTA